jgi:hypothetical protein
MRLRCGKDAAIMSTLERIGAATIGHRPSNFPSAAIEPPSTLGILSEIAPEKGLIAVCFAERAF